MDVYHRAIVLLALTVRVAKALQSSYRTVHQIGASGLLPGCRRLKPRLRLLSPPARAPRCLPNLHLDVVVAALVNDFEELNAPRLLPVRTLVPETVGSLASGHRGPGTPCRG